MIHQDVRTAILALKQQGHGSRSIAKALKVSRWVVRTVLRAGNAEVPRPLRPEKAKDFEAEVRELHARCKGNLVRVHEELLALGARLSYQSLTGFCRRHGIGHEPKKPAGRYHFEPGQEMQHDTSPHGIRSTNCVATSLSEARIWWRTLRHKLTDESRSALAEGAVRPRGRNEVHKGRAEAAN